ncbi:hypothetical bacteriophage protein [Salmonella enterica subsp. salamae]|nr:hypothetical bacteriophage protein [Salmonella enterica subsp. salamae]
MTNTKPTDDRVLQLLSQFEGAYKEASILQDDDFASECADIVRALREVLACRAALPVADVVAWSSPNEERTCDIRWRRHDVSPGPLYTAPQPLNDAERAELQELRRNYLALRGEIEDVRSQLYEAESQANEYASELQERREADNQEPALEREQVRHEHAEWSDATFGDVGPIGPLKHLSKEALEAAADPSDPLEWADMQFLLWDAQRRMGISDEFITRAMIEKLEINKSRQWPEPKDGEPRLHIKEQPAPVVPEECPAKIRELMASHSDALFNDGDAQEIWNACCIAMLQGVEQPQNARQNIPENIPDGNSPVIPEGKFR